VRAPVPRPDGAGGALQSLVRRKHRARQTEREHELVLSDRTIREQLRAGRIVIDPLDDSDIQPASVDLHLHRRLLVLGSTTAPFIDLRSDLTDLVEPADIPEDEPFLIQPGEFVLVSTVERIGLPDDLVAQVKGKSSLARAGLLVAPTAGYVDPGWDGRLTLELVNASRLPASLYAGMRICQIYFMSLTTRADKPYGSPGLGSRYQGQNETTASRLHIDFDSRRRPADG